jgi:hypothetical protein
MMISALETLAMMRALIVCVMMSSGFYYKTADGLTLRAQNKRGALAISPTIVFSVYY